MHHFEQVNLTSVVVIVKLYMMQDEFLGYSRKGDGMNHREVYCRLLSPWDKVSYIRWLNATCSDSLQYNPSIRWSLKFCSVCMFVV